MKIKTINNIIETINDLINKHVIYLIELGLTLMIKHLRHHQAPIIDKYPFKQHYIPR